MGSTNPASKRGAVFLNGIGHNAPRNQGWSHSMRSETITALWVSQLPSQRHCGERAREQDEHFLRGAATGEFLREYDV